MKGRHWNGLHREDDGTRVGRHEYIGCFCEQPMILNQTPEQHAEWHREMAGWIRKSMEMQAWKADA